VRVALVLLAVFIGGCTTQVPPTATTGSYTPPPAAPTLNTSPSLPGPSPSVTTAPATVGPTPSAIVSLSPPTVSPAAGLSAIAPALPYTTAAFAPTIIDRDNVLDVSTKKRVLDEAAAVLKTVTGQPYATVSATFDCTGSGLCQLKIVGRIANGEDTDTWWFNLGTNAALFELETSKTYSKTIWWSVPRDAVAELAALIAADPEAANRASAYLDFDHAAWFPSKPKLLSMTYSSPSGFVAGPPIANATTNYLTITIDITTRKVIDYGQMQLDG
jgi:hypothetical protein